MLSIRPFKENDNEMLLEIEELCPQGNDSRAMGVKKMDIIARYRMYDDWSVMVAEEDGEIAGWIGWTVKRAGDQDEPYVYLVEVMVHPKFRRKGIAAKLIEEAERNARQASCSHIYCYIYEPNDAPQALFKGLAYSRVADVKTCAISTYRKANVSQNFSIGHIDKKDFGEVLNLINNYYKCYRHFVPYTEENFMSHLERIPGYGSDNFWALKNQGKIVACGGLWDCSVLADQCYAREPLSWKLMGSLLQIFGLFMKVPKIAREGVYFKYHLLADIAFDPVISDAMPNLLGFFNNLLLETKRDCFVAVVDPSDKIIEPIGKFRPQIETMEIFAKSLHGELPKFCPFYVDIRDMVL